MSFLNNLVNEFTHKNSGQSYQQQPSYGDSGNSYSQQQQYGGGYNSGGAGAPQVPPPWISEWDDRENRWIFINRETGQRSYEFPQQGYSGQYGGYAPPAQNRQQNYYGEERGRDEQQHKSHSGRNVALGAAAGVAGGALLMHEGEKVENKWDEDKYRMENDVGRADDWADRKVADGAEDVEDFPENAANWTGRKVQDVEDIPENIENRWDNGVQDVEDIPEDVSGWAGRKVGDVERFDDNVDNAYDAGRDDTRYDDDRRYDDDNNNNNGW